MGIRYRRKLLVRALLLLVVLLLGGLVVTGCVGGTTVPKGWSGATIADGTLFVGSMQGKLVAVDISDGSRLWAAPLEASAPASGFFGRAPTVVAIYGSPVVAGDLVYVGGYNGIVYALAFDREEPRWVYPRQGSIGGNIVGGLIVAQGKIYFGSAEGKVYALDAADGFKEWEFPPEDKKDEIGKIWSTPAIAGDTLFIGSFDKKVYALNAADGSPKWEFPTEGAIIATPVVDNNTVYIGSFDRYLYALDATDGSLKWKFPAESWFWAKPVVKGNIIYAASLDGKVYALDAGNGNKLDEFNLGSSQDPISASPVLAGNSVIVATEDGVVYTLDAGSKKKKELRRLGEKVQAPLATDGTVVYIHTGDGKLYALNAQSGAELWSPVSLKSAPSASPSQPASGGTNWGLLIVITVIGILSVLFISARAKRRRA